MRIAVLLFCVTLLFSCSGKSSGSETADIPDSNAEATSPVEILDVTEEATSPVEILDVTEEAPSPVEVLEEALAPEVEPEVAGPDYESWYYPPKDSADDGWESVPPEALGWDPALLQEALDYLAATNATAFIILYKGRIVVEQYWEGWGLHTTGQIYSSSKSMVGYLVGKAQEEGLLGIDDTVTAHLGDGWSNALKLVEKKITIRHLLTMTSGLTKLLTFAAQPDTVWKYNTPAYKILHQVLEAATGMTLNDYATQHVFEPTGFRDTEWTEEWMISSARDMSRFGLMILAGGAWEGQQLMDDQGYFADMLESSQQLNPSYGYLWWLNGKDGWVLPDDTPGSGFLIPNAPADMAAALGYADKKIYVIPSLHLVVVRHGDAADSSQPALSDFDNILWGMLVAAM